MKFTEDLKQAWIKKHSEVDIGMSDLHPSDGCFCALGSFLDVLADRGMVNWKLTPLGSYRAELTPREDGYVKTDYEILYSIPFFSEKIVTTESYINTDRICEIYRLNDRVYRELGEEASRGAVLEYISNLPVEE